MLMEAVHGPHFENHVKLDKIYGSQRENDNKEGLPNCPNMDAYGFNLYFLGYQINSTIPLCPAPNHPKAYFLCSLFQLVA